MDEHEQRALLATACHILYKLGLSDYLGHPSVRLDERRVLIKPKHSPSIRGMDTMGPRDMVVIDLDGKLLDGAGAHCEQHLPRLRPRRWDVGEGKRLPRCSQQLSAHVPKPQSRRKPEPILQTTRQRTSGSGFSPGLGPGSENRAIFGLISQHPITIVNCGPPACRKRGLAAAAISVS